jgi:hypothetical protein
LSALLTWLEASGLGHVMRESGPWTYAVINLVHILGVAALFGSLLILDLRLLGVWRRIPLASLADAAAPVAATGFGIAATSGLALLSANGSEYIGNPFLLIKFPAIGVGVVNALAVSRSSAWRARRVRELTRPERCRLAVMGGASLVSWLVALSAGRLIGYW